MFDRIGVGIGVLSGPIVKRFLFDFLKNKGNSKVWLTGTGPERRLEFSYIRHVYAGYNL